MKRLDLAEAQAGRARPASPNLYVLDLRNPARCRVARIRAGGGETGRFSGDDRWWPLVRVLSGPPRVDCGAEPDRDLARARLCYDHLAGRLGIALVQSLTGRQWIGPDDFALTADGDGHLTSLGIDIAALRRMRRPLTRPCADWTERLPHLAGSLGAAAAEAWT